MRLGDLRRRPASLLMGKGEVVRVFDPELTELQQQVLDSFHVPAGVYASSSSSGSGGRYGSR
ncbi:MAG: hypothetical protein WAV54_03590 [Acidimicrobiales bacterium]